MKQNKKNLVYLNLWKSSKLKSLLGLFVGISIPQIIIWAKFLPIFISAPTIAAYSFFVIYLMKIIFNIDSRLKIDNKFPELIERQNKVVPKFVFLLVVAIIGIIQLVRVLNNLNFEFEVRMKILSFTTIVATFAYLISLWIYYKHLLMKNDK